MVQLGNIIKFNENATQQAAIWCRDNGIHGKVIQHVSDLYELEVGLYYKIYARPDQFDVIAQTGTIETIPYELANFAPIPDDGC